MTMLTYQRLPADCVIASLSMLLELEYEEVYNVHQKIISKPLISVGVTDYETLRIAKQLKRRLKIKNGKPNGRAVLVVRLSEKDGNHPSLCGDNEGYHAVYYDGTNVFDPDNPKSDITMCTTTAQYLEHTIYHFKESKWF